MMQMQFNWLRGEVSKYLNLVGVTDGQQGYVAFAQYAPLPFHVHDNNDDVEAEFYSDCFYIDNVKYQYNQLIDYKNIPSVLQYLKQQNL